MTDRYRPYRLTTLRGRAFRSFVNVAVRASGLAHRVDQGWPRFEGGPHGDAPPIVLVHGFGVDGTTMLQLGRLLVRKHRVIVPDLPGFGAAPFSPPFGPPGGGGGGAAAVREADVLACGMLAKLGRRGQRIRRLYVVSGAMLLWYELQGEAGPTGRTWPASAPGHATLTAGPRKRV